MPENTFLRYFANEPVVLAADAFTCPQSTPATTKVSAEGRANYGTLRPNAAAGYGMTGLMAMATWNTSCYGQVMPGYVFLFPGINQSTSPAYTGTVNINCSSHAPLN